MKRFVLCIALSYLILIAGCSPSPSVSLTAKQNLNAAQVQATNAALSEQAVQQSTAQAVQQAQQNAKRATEAARVATQQAVNATEQARADAAHALTLEQAQAAATATRAALDRQMGLDIAAVTKQAGEIRATATVIAKLQVTEDDRISRQRTDDDLTFLVGWIIKGGAVLLVLIAGITIIEIMRKRGSVSKIGNHTVAVDGGLFGGMEIYLLEADRSTPLLLNAPEPVVNQPEIVHQHLVNHDHAIDAMSDKEFEDRYYWRTRCTRFLQEAMETKGKDGKVKGLNYKKIPTCREMEMPEPEWVENTNALKPWIDKQQGKPTLCVAPYETLGKLHEAIATKKISPLPPKLYAKYNGNSYQQVTVEQSVTGDNSGKTVENSPNSPVSRLDGAVAALPGVNR